VKQVHARSKWHTRNPVVSAKSNGRYQALFRAARPMARPEMTRESFVRLRTIHPKPKYVPIFYAFTYRQTAHMYQSLGSAP
jgi:hypothetical protein